VSWWDRDAPEILCRADQVLGKAPKEERAIPPLQRDLMVVNEDGPHGVLSISEGSILR